MSAKLIIEMFVKSYQLCASLMPLSSAIEKDIWKRRLRKIDHWWVYRKLMKLNTDEYIHARMAMKAR